MKKHAILLAILTVGAVSCGDNHSNSDAGSGSDAAQIPNAPALGAQIDRLGRPAINTALNHAFDPTPATKNAAKDAYNAESDPTTWASDANKAQFAANLAIFDALDTVCGNQVLYDGSPEGGGPVTADSYSTLTGLLLDDQLYLDSTQTACNLYLAVELNVVSRRAGVQRLRWSLAERGRDRRHLQRGRSRFRAGSRSRPRRRPRLSVTAWDRTPERTRRRIRPSRSSLRRTDEARAGRGRPRPVDGVPRQGGPSRPSRGGSETRVRPRFVFGAEVAA